MDSLKCQTSTASPAQPGDLLCWFSVTFHARAPEGEFDQTHKVMAAIVATNSKYQYQTFLFTKSDAEKCAASIVNACGEPMKERLAVQLLRSMDAEKFLATLTKALKFRLHDQLKAVRQVKHMVKRRRKANSTP